VATNDPATAHFTAIKTWETQVSHTNQGTRTPTYTLKHQKCAVAGSFFATGV
jgi:hypothetical protein